MISNPRFGAMLGLLGFGFGALVLSTGHAGAQAGGGHISDVNVVNTPNVHVTSLPAVQIGSNQSINVGNSPTVGIAPDQSVHVSSDSTVHIASDSTVQVSGSPTVQIAPGQGINVDNSPTVHLAPDATVHIAADQKLHIADNHGQVLWNSEVDTQAGSAELPFVYYTVPAGKRLVIEGASYLAGDSSLVFVRIATLTGHYYLPLFPAVNGFASASAPVTIRVDAGGIVGFEAVRTNYSLGSHFSGALAGHLEDAP